MNEPIISLAGLTKSYGDLCAVCDLSLRINRGEIFGFLGANGAGKTTTMRMLCGLTPPDRREERRSRAPMSGANVRGCARGSATWRKSSVSIRT